MSPAGGNGEDKASLEGEDKSYFRWDPHVREYQQYLSIRVILDGKDITMYIRKNHPNFKALSVL